MSVATEQRAWARQSASSLALMALSEKGCSRELRLSLCLASQPFACSGCPVANVQSEIAVADRSVHWAAVDLRQVMQEKEFME